MPRYDDLYDIMATRAIEQARSDLGAFLKRMRVAGATDVVIKSMLLDDLDADGPLFGRFGRMVAQAAVDSVMAAERQGGVVGAILHDEDLRAEIEGDDAALKELLDTERLGIAIEEADPEQLGEIESAAEDVSMRSVAELVKTCHRCLPLHGMVRTLGEWSAMGLLPEVRHEGWASECHCQLIPEHQAAEREDLIAPLLRASVAKDPFGRRTARDVAQANLAKSVEVVTQARQSEEGRAVLRRLGQANAEMSP